MNRAARIAADVIGFVGFACNLAIVAIVIYMMTATPPS